MAEPFPAEGLFLEEDRSRALETIGSIHATAHSKGLATELLPLKEALGRVSAQAIVAREAVPGFCASIMDGYAITDELPPEPGTHWHLVGRSAPGAPYEEVLKAGEAIRILTGAPVPQGARRVVPQELTTSSADGGVSHRLHLAKAAGLNAWIRSPEEEAAWGERLVEAGVRLGPAALGRLASCGVATVTTWRLPRIGLLISGDELVAPGNPRGPGQIWESNGTLIESLLERLGQGVEERRVVGDQPAALRVALRELAARTDVVVSTGGVSSGDSDWIRPLLEELGSVSFWKLFLKPGRPFAFGTLGGKPFFGLPGNPVAAAITALQLLWPALQILEGLEPQTLPRLRVRLVNEVKRASGRPELARARLSVATDGSPLALVDGSQASSRIGSLQGADLLLEIPAEAEILKAGAELWAQLLRLPIF